MGTNPVTIDGEMVGFVRPSPASHAGLKSLMLAVLDNGIASYFSSTPRIRAEAEYWIDTRARRSPFSFTVVCETLDLEPDAVRAALQRERERSGFEVGTPGRRTSMRRGGRMLARTVAEA